MSERTPWATMLSAARALGVPPHRFWRLSLNEWRALTRSVLASHRMERGDFEVLAARFPDR